MKITPLPLRSRLKAGVLSLSLTLLASTPAHFLSAQSAVVLDNADATGVNAVGGWTSSTTTGYWGIDSLLDGNTGKGSKSVLFTPTIPTTGNYQVFLRWVAGSNRSNAVPVDVTSTTGTDPVSVNQQLTGSTWVSLGTYPFNAGTSGSVLLSNTGTTGYVSADAVSFASTTKPTTLSPFGFSMSSQSKGTYAQWVPQMAAIGAKWSRGFALFGNIEPTEGTWSWTQGDGLIATNTANGLNTIGMLGLTAPWISTTQSFPVTNIPAWKTYITATVNRYKNDIKYWEVWNEPPNFTQSTGTPTDYSAIVVAAYDAAKAADPNCLIGLAAKSTHINWLDQTIKAGAKDHFDFITLHPYEMMGCLIYGWEPEFFSQVGTVRKMLAAQNPAKVNVPIIFTEIGESVGGTNGPVTVTAAIQAQDLVKVYALGIAQGVSLINWFEAKDGDSGPMGLIDSAGVQRPSYTAMAKMIQYLGDHPQYLGWIMINGNDYGFIFQGPTYKVLITWAPRDVTNTVNFGQTVQIVNPLTGGITSAGSYALTTAPIMVLNPPTAMVTTAAANVNQPLSWGADYTNASQVSIDLGPTNTESGVHFLKPDVTSVGVTAPYGPARDCNIPKGTVQYLTCDPNFLSYTSTPIEISVDVHANAANDPAVLRLQYESVTGMKYTTKYTVPDNTQWYTATWTINDSQFVGMYGFNFTINSPTSTQNKYYLKNVTIKKVGVTASTPFITGQTLGTLRNNYTGWMGCKITVGATPITVTDLGRWVVAGNTGYHTVKIVQGTSQVTVASALVNTAGATPGQFVYAPLATPVTLAANTVYYVASQETTGGDQFYNYDTTVTTASQAVLNLPAYSVNGNSFSTGGTVGNRCYVPVNFKMQ